MTGLADTVLNIGRYRKAMAARIAMPFGEVGRPGAADVASFGENPGALRMLMDVPPSLAPGAPLVVVLHGCGQTAAAYAAGAGWLTLAERFGFAVLMPEQSRANNAGGCFNWFEPGDTRREQGEAKSIKSMVDHAIDGYRLDRRRVFVTGLSAGGAMANALLAAYPDLFSAGAIIAGLPYGVASSTQTALAAMFQPAARSALDLGNLVRAAAPHRGPFPRIAVWHGEADHTVAPLNGAQTVSQWLDVHGIGGPGEARAIGSATYRSWRGADGKVAVEQFVVPKLGHGTPISAHDSNPLASCGAAAPFILEAGLSSSYLIAQSWGLIGQPRVPPATPAQPAKTSVLQVIERTLRGAGLKR